MSGLSCPQYNITTDIQYEVANSRLRRYNFIFVLEKLKDAKYVAAIEKFFNVTGAKKRRSAYCEKASRKANEINPANITNETLTTLAKLNEIDLRLYHDLTDCNDEYDFGKFYARV